MTIIYFEHPFIWITLSTLKSLSFAFSSFNSLNYVLVTVDQESIETATDWEEKDNASEVTNDTDNNDEKSEYVSEDERAKLVQKQNKITSDLIFGVERQISKMYQDKDPNKELKEAQQRFDDVTSKLADTTWGLTGTKRSDILESERLSRVGVNDLEKLDRQGSKKSTIQSRPPSPRVPVKRSLQGSVPTSNHIKNSDMTRNKLTKNSELSPDLDGNSFGRNIGGFITTTDARKKEEVEDDNEGENDEGDYFIYNCHFISKLISNSNCNNIQG